jgi:guanylate kinase
MGRIIVLVGPSGSGKTTIAKELLMRNIFCQMVTSYTTRAARDTDLPGEYHYASLEYLDTLNAAKKLLWPVVKGGTAYYGTTRNSVTAVLDDPEALGIMILEPSVIEILTNFVYHYRGRNSWSNLILVFLIPPSQDEQIRRMHARGDTELQIARRLRHERNWESDAHASTLPYLFVVTNTPPKETVNEIKKRLYPKSPGAS